MTEPALSLDDAIACLYANVRSIVEALGRDEGEGYVGVVPQSATLARFLLGKDRVNAWQPTEAEPYMQAFVAGFTEHTTTGVRRAISRWVVAQRIYDAEAGLAPGSYDDDVDGQLIYEDEDYRFSISPQGLPRIVVRADQADLLAPHGNSWEATVLAERLRPALLRLAGYILAGVRSQDEEAAHD